jgi:hypothetical protein
MWNLNLNTSICVRPTLDRLSPKDDVAQAG